MRKQSILALAFFLAAALTVTAVAQDEPKKEEPKKGEKGEKGGRGFGGGFRMPTPGEILSSFMQERLKFTDDQKKQLADIQKDVDTKLEKIMTDDQKAEFKKMKEQRFGGGRPPRSTDKN